MLIGFKKKRVWSKKILKGVGLLISKVSKSHPSYDLRNQVCRDFTYMYMFMILRIVDEIDELLMSLMIIDE